MAALNLPTVKVAAAHIAPVWLDAAATLRLTLDAIAEASSHNASLVVFAESHLPGFPYFAGVAAPIDNHDLFARFVANSVHVDGPEIRAVRDAAAKHEIAVSLGFSETAGPERSAACLWNSNVLIGPDGALLNHHRKICATWYEKLVWASGDAAGLRVVDTPGVGRVGGLICGESTSSLAKFPLIAQGQQIHISTWPAAWPTKRPSPGQPGGGLATANELRTSAHCFEAKAFGILSAGFLDTATRDELVSLIPSSADVLDACPRAPTCFVGPNGARLTSAGLEPGEKSERKEEQGMAYAIFDLKQTIEGKQYHDVVGSYGRPDIFELVVNRRREVPVVWKGENQRLGSQNELGAGKEEEGRAYV